MKKLLVMVLVAVMSSTLVVPVMAAKKSAKSDVVTHEELGKIMVNMLGLAKYLPPQPSSQQIFSVLSVNGVAPGGGWEVGKNVTRADLARVIVQGIGDADKVKNPDDDKSWIDYLASIGVPIDTVGQATDNLKPLINPVAQNVTFQSTTDPLKKPESTSGRFPDDDTFGTDMAFLPTVTREELVEVIAAVDNTGRRRRPVTPN